MSEITISALLCNALVALFCLVIAVIIIAMIQSIVHEHRAENRRIQQEKRDLEYHQKRMKD